MCAQHMVKMPEATDASVVSRRSRNKDDVCDHLSEYTGIRVCENSPKNLTQCTFAPGVNQKQHIS